jgi:hypothetical protein
LNQIVYWWTLKSLREHKVNLPVCLTSCVYTSTTHILERDYCSIIYFICLLLSVQLACNLHGINLSHTPGDLPGFHINPLVDPCSHSSGFFCSKYRLTVYSWPASYFTCHICSAIHLVMVNYYHFILEKKLFVADLWVCSTLTVFKIRHISCMTISSFWCQKVNLILKIVGLQTREFTTGM